MKLENHSIKSNNKQISFPANRETTNRCRRNQEISTISGSTNVDVVTNSAPANPRDKFTDLPPTYDEAVKVHLSAFPTEPAPAYTPTPAEEPSLTTEHSEAATHPTV